MIKDEKDLLLKDLCARLPYGVKIDNMGVPSMLTSINNKYRIIVETEEVDKEPRLDVLEIEDCKPYLFPLSSITDEQEEELKNIYYNFNGMFQYTERIFDKIPFRKMKYFPYQIEEFFNKNHIDYRGLIPMGLAIDATGKNIY